MSDEFVKIEDLLMKPVTKSVTTATKTTSKGEHVTTVHLNGEEKTKKGKITN